MKAHDEVFLAGADARSKVMNNKRLAHPDPTALGILNPVEC
jgi:hypothetical protein